MKRLSKKLRPTDPLREATTVAISRLIDPLLDLMFDTGVTVQDLNKIVRERAVRNATKRVIRESGRESRARVAIATGVPRAAVASILESRDRLDSARRGQHPARRVLSAWYEDIRFLSRDGEPAILPIFGGGASFEYLVNMHSGGTPVRAMLDELTRIDAIERLPNQQVRAKSRVPILTGLNASGIAMVGERAGDLMETLVRNLRRSTPPLFEATALIGDADPEKIGVIQREVNQHSVSFINGINSLLNRSRIKKTGRSAATPLGRRLGVTVYYFEEQNGGTSDFPLKSPQRRTNLRRRDKKAGERSPHELSLRDRKQKDHTTDE